MEALRVWWDASLPPNQHLDAKDGVGGVGPKHNGLSIQGLDKDLEAICALLFGRWFVVVGDAMSSNEV